MPCRAPCANGRTGSRGSTRAGFSLRSSRTQDPAYHNFAGERTILSDGTARPSSTRCSRSRSCGFSSLRDTPVAVDSRGLAGFYALAKALELGNHATGSVIPQGRPSLEARRLCGGSILLRECHPASQETDTTVKAGCAASRGQNIPDVEGNVFAWSN